MISGNDRFEAEAIFFFDNGQVIKEMLYVEFEAVLDGVVGIPECKSDLHQAAYVSIGNELRVQTVVLFTVEFDAYGHIPKAWNLPLRYLASQADMGPNLGDGAIKVMSACNCDDPEYAQHMWDCGKGLIEVLTSIKGAVKRNKLSLYLDAANAGFADSLAAAHGMNSAYFPSQSNGNQNYLVANLESALRDQHERIRAELETAHADAIREKTNENVVLKERSAAVERQLRIVEEESRKQIDVIVDKYKAKLRSQLAKQDASWQEKLAEMELSLHYALEKEHQARDELQSIEDGRGADRADAITTFLQQLSAKGVEFIVSESGIGSHALKLYQVQGFMENQASFWAAQCGVSETKYLAWSAHYKHPVCQAGASTGCECGTAVSRVDHVRNFVISESDMCQEHRLKRVGEYY